MIEIAVLANHVHALVESGPRMDLPRLAQQLKGASSRYVNLDRGRERPLRWAPGYHVQAVSVESIPNIRAYFDRQATKHKVDWAVRWSRSVLQDV